ncbi:protein ACCELERATED CELL DEATH [Salix suchowensis]|nr:protein ACCELERATED CELL DEATH [Salix suchowensis]
MAQAPPNPRNPERSISWFKRFQYDKERDSPSDARNVLLVIATLIAAVTFQAGVNPPGGVWQDDGGGKEFHAPGSAIYASRKSPYYVFLVSNTLALSASILVITSLTYRFPFHFEIWVATASMMITYASAIFAVTPRESVHFRFILITAVVPFVARFLIQMLKKFRKSKKRAWSNKLSACDQEVDGQTGQRV